MTHILVFGQAGQLARALKQETVDRPDEIVFYGSKACDLREAGAAEQVIHQLQPRIIINAAAYTDVRAAEQNVELAHRLNAEAPEEMAKASRALGAAFVHISTDYVFDGNRGGAWSETDETGPLNVYGRTKQEGEARILAMGANSAIIRTSWVFSKWGRNFVSVMLELARSRDFIEVVDDQIGRPTFAPHLARICLDVGEGLAAGQTALRGLLHYADQADCSWAAFAAAILAESRALGGPGADIRAKASDFGREQLHRPLNSVLSTQRYEALFGRPTYEWRAGLLEVVSHWLAQQSQ